MDVSKVTIKNLLEAGIHFGHKTKRWNPKMENYIFGERNGIHIIDLQQTVNSFRNALEVVKKFSSQNKNILFVGTKRQASEIISNSAIKCEQYYINNRWLGGMLTNWDTIQNSIKRLKDLEVVLEEQSFTYTKNETLQFEKSVEKLNKALGGIKNMNGRPDLLFIIDTNREVLAVKEAVKMGIPIIAVLDSTRVFRLARAVGMNVVVMEYVEAARLRGERISWIMGKEILPNILPPLVAEFGLRFCYVFLMIASLSFLGVGIQPPTADWGSMVRDTGELIQFAAYDVTAALTPILPAAAIGILTIGVNFVVDWFLYLTSGLKDEHE